MSIRRSSMVGLGAIVAILGFTVGSTVLEQSAQPTRFDPFNPPDSTYSGTTTTVISTTKEPTQQGGGGRPPVRDPFRPPTRSQFRP
jgi:hypothetical protein